MTWILVIVLASGLSGPVEMDQLPCERAVQMLNMGIPIFVELDDGSKQQVISAECRQIEQVQS